MSGSTACSKAPISVPSPLAALARAGLSTGRATPRWSVDKPAIGRPWSRAGLPASKEWVLVGPPLSASGASNGLVAGLSFAPNRFPVLSVQMLLSPDAKLVPPGPIAARFDVPVPAKIELLKWQVSMCPPCEDSSSTVVPAAACGAKLSANVQETSVSIHDAALLEWHHSPAPPPVVATLPLKVQLVNDAGPKAATPPPPLPWAVFPLKVQRAKVEFCPDTDTAAPESPAVFPWKVQAVTLPCMIDTAPPSKTAVFPEKVVPLSRRLPY